MLKFVRVKLNERVILSTTASRWALGPGRHAVWGRKPTEQRWSTDTLVFQSLSEVRAILPREWSRRSRSVCVSVASSTATASRRCFCVRVSHRFWTVDPSVTARGALGRRSDAGDVGRARCGDCRVTSIVDAQVRQYERGLHYVQGRFVGMLEPGRYALWNHPDARVDVQVDRHASCSS